MPRGGSRRGAGRKSSAELRSIRQVIKDTISEKQWHILVKDLYDRARQGNLRAAEILFTYSFGNPYADPAPEKELHQIKVIEVFPPEPRIRSGASRDRDQSQAKPPPLWE